jgi:membrane-associated phospholipid phosphatase
MKRVIFLMVISLLVNSLSGQHNYWKYQSSYNISLKKDLITSGISLTTILIGYSFEKNEDLPPFTMGSFTQSDINKINFIDRGVAGRWDIGAVNASDILKTASKKGVQLALVLFPGNLKARSSLYLIYLEGYFLTNGLTSLAKGITDRYRPFTYRSLAQIDKLNGKAKEQFFTDVSTNGIEDSFFSGHASSTAFSLIFFAKVFNDYFPDTKWKYGVWGLSITGTVLESYFRAKSGEHFPTDVIAGSLVGGSIGFFLPYLHRISQSQRFTYNLSFNGLSLNYKF